MGKRRPNKNKTCRGEGCVPFGSIQSEDPPYLRGRDIYSWGVSAGMKAALPLPETQALSESESWRWGAHTEGFPSSEAAPGPTPRPELKSPC